MVIFFLGTGGGRFTTITQKRRTAGIRVITEGSNFHIDPGPGALVYSIKERLDPKKLSAVFVSHSHPDHYTDAEVLIEAMTRGMTVKRGTVVAAKSVLLGGAEHEPSVSKYHQRNLDQVIVALPGLSLCLGDLDVVVTEARHSDPDAVGFRFKTVSFGDFAYTSDTEYFEGIGKYYERVRLLILCVMRPSGRPLKGHMTTDDVVKVVEAAKPEKAVLTHLGMQMISAGPAKEAKLVEEKTGVSTVAAGDGMRIRFGKTIDTQMPKSQNQQGLSSFF